MSCMKIGLAVPARFTSTFVCEIETMWNDADDYETLEIPFETYQADSLVEYLSKLARRRDPTRLSVADFTGAFFETDDNAYWFTDEWPYDGDSGLPYGYQRHALYWYDGTGRKFSAEYLPG